MAGTPKAHVDADAVLGPAAASLAKRNIFDQVFGVSPAATSRSASMPSPTLRSSPLTVESLSATVHQLMRDMEDQRIKLEEQAKTIASWEAGIAAAEGESTAAANATRFSDAGISYAEWGDDHEGHRRGGRQDPWCRWHDESGMANDPWSDPPGLVDSTPWIAGGLPSVAPAQEDSWTAGGLPSAASSADAPH